MTTFSQFLKDVEKLEPKNIIDYILHGSGLNRYIKLKQKEAENTYESMGNKFKSNK